MNRFQQQGSTLVVSMIFMLIIAIAVGVASLYTSQMSSLAQRDRLRDQAISIGNAYLEYGFSHARDAATSQGLAPMTPASFSSITTAAANSYLTNYITGSAQNLASYTVTPNYTLFGTGAQQFVYPATPELVPLTATDATATKANGTTDASYPYYYYYLISVTVTATPYTGVPVTVSVTRVLQEEIGNPFADAIFYNDLLEFHPGAATVVNGNVQSNGDEYLGASGGSLEFQGLVTYSGSGAYTKFYDGAHSGSPTAPTYDDGTPTYTATQSPMGISPSLFSKYAGNPNVSDSYREIIEPPVSGTSDPLQSATSSSPSARMYDNADVKILLSNDANGNTQIQLYDGTGGQVTAASPGSVDQAIWNLFGNSTSSGTGTISTGGVALSSTVTSSTTKKVVTTSTSYTTSTATLIQDYRESSTVPVNLTALNIGNITSTAANTINTSGSGIVIYIADTRATDNSTTPTSSQVRDGVILTNGTALPNYGLTVVSENPVYIAGNYNTANNYAVVSGTHPPAAVIADAVNILSPAAPTNSGTSSSSLYAYSIKSESSRAATTDTVNSAILSGNVPSVADGSYSGGVENFPRFLENWGGGVTFNYNGSMVEMFKSQQAVGIWRNASYTPPTRKWYFDSLFLNHPPPGTFYTQQFSKQRWMIQ